MAEKTEQATPKKLRDARKKGQVAKSQDFPSAFTFVVSISTVLLSAGYVYEILSSFLVSMFKMSSSDPDLQNRAGGILMQTIMVIFNASLPIVLVTVLVGLLVNLIIVGPMFSMEAMKPDVKRLNPVTNIKNLFKFKTLFELLKSVFKILGALVLIYSVMWNSLGEIISTAGISVFASSQVFLDFLVKVVIRVGMFFLAIAIFDLIFQKRTFSKEMMMEKFEVKQEYKDTEGDPHMKSKRRQTAQEIAYQEGVQSVKRSRAVITNPVHIAVAIEYDPETEPAPKIVVMGKEAIADTIIRLAQEYGIPIMRNVTLAQTLFEKGRISDYVPEETYQAIAEILRWLEGIEKIETQGLELFK
jgi:type III secretion protein U